jgi:hypothetical protein
MMGIVCPSRSTCSRFVGGNRIPYLPFVHVPLDLSVEANGTVIVDSTGPQANDRAADDRTRDGLEITVDQSQFNRRAWVQSSVRSKECAGR